MTARPPTSDAVYLLPLRWEHPDDGELTRYLRRLSSWIEVVVVDGSPDHVVSQHRALWRGLVTHLAPRPPLPGENGKAVAVMEGLRATTAPLVVIADDDVRYDEAGLRRILGLLQDSDLVRPQNTFHPLPWHARWDTARALVNRAGGGDYPGTLALRRGALPCGYDTHVLFENLELVRTIRAGGGREHRALDLFVARRPPTTGRFLSQRVRQAYDSQAQPARLAVELALLPLLAWAARVPSRLVAMSALAALAAERGRSRADGRIAFPASCVLFAPAWVAERAVCSWVAVAHRLTGGIRYSGSRLRCAAHSERWIRERLLTRPAERRPPQAAELFPRPGARGGAPGRRPGLAALAPRRNAPR